MKDTTTMNETYVRERIRLIMISHGYTVYTVPDGIVCTNKRCRRVIVPPAGLPDLTITHPILPALYIEVKILRNNQPSFPLNSINPDQRAHLSLWTAQRGSAYIGFGCVRQHRLANLYLIDWEEWLQIEKLILPHQSRIPYDSKNRLKHKMRENQLYITSLFAPWEISKQLPTSSTAHPSTRAKHTLSELQHLSLMEAFSVNR